MDGRERDDIVLPVLAGEMDRIAFAGPAKRSGELLAAAQRLGERDAGLMALPIVIIGEPCQRPVDPRRADLETVAALDRIASLRFQCVEFLGQLARNLFAVAEVELTRRRVLGHDLKRGVRRAAQERHAHEPIAEAFNLGLQQCIQRGNVRHSIFQRSNVSRTGAVGPQPQASDDVEERSAI